MLPYGYNPESYGGIVWWCQTNKDMCLIWGTQETYDNFKKQGGSWWQYEQIAHERMQLIKEYGDTVELPEFSVETFINGDGKYKTLDQLIDDRVLEETGELSHFKSR